VAPSFSPVNDEYAPAPNAARSARERRRFERVAGLEHERVSAAGSAPWPHRTTVLNLGRIAPPAECSARMSAAPAVISTLKKEPSCVRARVSSGFVPCTRGGGTRGRTAQETHHQPAPWAQLWSSLASLFVDPTGLFIDTSGPSHPAIFRSLQPNILAQGTRKYHRVFPASAKAGCNGCSEGQFLSVRNPTRLASIARPRFERDLTDVSPIYGTG